MPTLPTDLEAWVRGIAATQDPRVVESTPVVPLVTRGGVSVRQVSPSTMSSRLIRGLYFAGEVLDVDAMTGGFNLHIAFATGALAGHAAALYALENN